MNSSKIFSSRIIAFVAVLSTIITLDCQAITVSQALSERGQARSQGIFGRMLDEVTKPERLEKERHKATLRKEQQLAEAQQDFEQIVQTDEMYEQEKQQRTMEQDQQQQQRPKQNLLAATNDQSQINVSEIEANLQANLQAKIDAGASKAELLASIGQEGMVSESDEVMSQNMPQQPEPMALPDRFTNNQEVLKPALPPAPKTSKQETNKVKVIQVARQLDIPVTKELLALGSNEAISDSLIEQAMANGKTDQEINEAMAAL